MKERPILFSTEMVKAILDGKKTMTRRVIKPQPPLDKWGIKKPWNVSAFSVGSPNQIDSLYEYKCPYGQPGDRLYVREMWGIGTRPDPFQGWVDGIEYKADELYLQGEDDLPLYRIIPDDFDITSKRTGWRPSIHMPRWASRITLEIINIRVERLQDITKDDACRDGGFIYSSMYVNDKNYAKNRFKTLWDSINGKKKGFSWNDDPWVWVISFKRI